MPSCWSRSQGWRGQLGSYLGLGVKVGVVGWDVTLVSESRLGGLAGILPWSRSQGWWGRLGSYLGLGVKVSGVGWDLTLVSESRLAGSAGIVASMVRVSTAITPTGMPPKRARPHTTDCAHGAMICNVIHNPGHIQKRTIVQPNSQVRSPTFMSPGSHRTVTSQHTDIL